MKRLKILYHKYIYGIIGTILFHIILFSCLLASSVQQKATHHDEPIVIDFSKKQPIPPLPEQKKLRQNKSTTHKQTNNSISNQAVNDANPTKNKKTAYDQAFEEELKAARKLAENVNKQLKKKIPKIKDLKMPAQTTSGQDPDSISNTIYSGASNIHYDLKDRYHIRLPIPVYLAQGGGKVQVNIWVKPDGTVSRAEAHLIGSTDDQMLTTYAKEAALQTQFNPSATASDPQQGTITYTFIPQ